MRKYAQRSVHPSIHPSICSSSRAAAALLIQTTHHHTKKSDSLLPAEHVKICKDRQEIIGNFKLEKYVVGLHNVYIIIIITIIRTQHTTILLLDDSIIIISHCTSRSKRKVSSYYIIYYTLPFIPSRSPFLKQTAKIRPGQSYCYIRASNASNLWSRVMHSIYY